MNPSETLATSIEGSTGDYPSLTGTQLANDAESDSVPEEDVLLGDLLKLMTINQKKYVLPGGSASPSLVYRELGIGNISTSRRSWRGNR